MLKIMMDGLVYIMHWLKDMVMAVLLVKLGADPNIVNNDGETPVKVAVDDKVAKYFTENI